MSKMKNPNFFARHRIENIVGVICAPQYAHIFFVHGLSDLRKSVKPEIDFVIAPVT